MTTDEPVQRDCTTPDACRWPRCSCECGKGADGLPPSQPLKVGQDGTLRIPPPGVTPCQTEQECEAPDLCRVTNGCERMEPPTRGVKGTPAPLTDEELADCGLLSELGDSSVESQEREAIIRAAVAAMPNANPGVADDLIEGHAIHMEADDLISVWQAARGVQGTSTASAAGPSE